MDNNRLFNWSQLIAAIAVVFGLGLVVWELQQAREIARVEQHMARFAVYDEGIRHMMGENAAQSLAKACDSPDDLTTEDMIVLGHYYNVVLNRFRSALGAAELSDDLTSSDWRQWHGNFHIIFATEYGRWWWSHQSWEPEIMQAGSRILAEDSLIVCSEYYDQYRQRGNDDG